MGSRGLLDPTPFLAEVVNPQRKERIERQVGGEVGGGLLRTRLPDQSAEPEAEAGQHPCPGPGEQAFLSQVPCRQRPVRVGEEAREGLRHTFLSLQTHQPPVPGRRLW